LKQIESFQNELRTLLIKKLIAPFELLRQYKNKEMFRIQHAYTENNLALFTTIKELSNLAEAILQQAYNIVQTNLQYKYGIPQDNDYKNTKFAIIGMGKLGGQELSFNSDLDLLFVYSQDGVTTGRIPNREFFNKLCQQLVTQMKNENGNGTVYDIDLRLCPYGENGPIALSLQGYQDYFDKYAQTWERQALIKARPVAGDLDLGQKFIEIAHDFVYKEPVASKELREIVEARKKKEIEVQEKEIEVQDIKKGYGGIIDIEFAVQALQLSYGVEMPSLRCTNTFDALEELNNSKIITSHKYEQLLEAYKFLRQVDNLLHLVYDEPNRSLPKQKNKLEKLARQLGYIDDEISANEKFMYDYRTYTSNTRKLFYNIIEHMGR